MPLKPGAIKIAEAITDMYHAPCGVGSANSFEVLMPEQFAKLLDIDFLGTSRHWDNRIRENSLLSLLNVRYIKVSRKSTLRPDLIASGDPHPRMKLVGKPMANPRQLDGDHNFFEIDGPEAEGVYVVSYDARATKGRASLLMDVYTQDLIKHRLSLLVYLCIAGLFVTGILMTSWSPSLRIIPEPSPLASHWTYLPVASSNLLLRS